MAARFGAKIVPFGAVGEDDIGEVSSHPPPPSLVLSRLLLAQRATE